MRGNSLALQWRAGEGRAQCYLLRPSWLFTWATLYPIKNILFLLMNVYKALMLALNCTCLSFKSGLMSYIKNDNQMKCKQTELT